jgi:3-oxoacyl-[acyl-carrier-protein] synthase III
LPIPHFGFHGIEAENGQTLLMQKGDGLNVDSALEMIAMGAWHGGTLVDNSVFENKGMFFKGGIPVSHETIEARVGVKTRVVAPPGEKIGVAALRDLLETSGIDPARIKLAVSATNLGEDKYDPGPAIRHPFELIRRTGGGQRALDLYAGCPGYNVAVELIFMLSMAGVLEAGDISVIVGAENPNRARTFRPLDTSNVLFGDDALAAALETKISAKPEGRYDISRARLAFGEDFVRRIARALFELNEDGRIDGIIVDNQLGKLEWKLPASAARVQSDLVQMRYPREASKGTLHRFSNALGFYNECVNGFAFDIMTHDPEPSRVEEIAKAYVRSGKYGVVASVYLARDSNIEVVLHKGRGYAFERPRYGIVDTLTRTHGCFSDYIQVVPENGDVFAEIDGKGVFLYATRGAAPLLTELLAPSRVSLEDMDLLIEHQANFAMIPMTLERALEDGHCGTKRAVIEYIAERMVTNIHVRGNASVVCMLRLPYDLQRGTLKRDAVQGFPVNRNLEALREARTVLYDSVGSGMTRSAFLERRR